MSAADDSLQPGGDGRECVARLYEQYYSRILAYCIRRLFDKGIAEDAAAAVFLKMVEHIHELRGREDLAVRSWLYRTATHVTLRHIRKNRRGMEILSEIACGGDGAASGSQVSPLDWPELYRAISQLPMKQQSVVILRFFEDMDVDEIGAILDMKPATVRVTLHRAIGAMEGILGDRI